MMYLYIICDIYIYNMDINFRLSFKLNSQDFSFSLKSEEV